MGLRAGSGLPNGHQTFLMAFSSESPKTVAEQSAIATVLLDRVTEIAVLDACRDKTRSLKARNDVGVADREDQVAVGVR